VAEFDGERLYILNGDTKQRQGMRGEIAPDCRSIVWKNTSNALLRTWER
jgi:hypothetical protein